MIQMNTTQANLQEMDSLLRKKRRKKGLFFVDRNLLTYMCNAMNDMMKREGSVRGRNNEVNDQRRVYDTISSRECYSNYYHETVRSDEETKVIVYVQYQWYVKPSDKSS